MKKTATALFAALSLAALSAAWAADKPTGEQPKAQTKPSGELRHVVTMQATVSAIDLDKRMVTLKGADGQETTIHVGESARNLKQVKVGDTVKVAYTEALAWKMSKSTKAEPTVEVEEAAGRSKEGDKPGGAAARRFSATATIEAIDLKKNTVTLKGPQGNTHTIKARNPANLKKVKVGDLVDISYTEAVALKVEPVAKK